MRKVKPKKSTARTIRSGSGIGSMGASASMPSQARQPSRGSVGDMSVPDGAYQPSWEKSGAH
jgi:hypothetical protein